MNSSPAIHSALDTHDVPPVVQAIPVEAEPVHDEKPVRMMGYTPPNLFRHARTGLRIAGIVLAISLGTLAHDLYARAAARPVAKPVVESLR